MTLPTVIDRVNTITNHFKTTHKGHKPEYKIKFPKKHRKSDNQFKQSKNNQDQTQRTPSRHFNSYSSLLSKPSYP